jgi:hypothetical protein
MKKDRQTIKCDVYNCRHCDLEEMCCSLREIKVSNCNKNKEKEATMCDCYSPKKD